mmetsp:Transcript_34273/g.50871  ORF Transcript_34273/g.50871 Transcript_34273/m.50871 type:complete len:84 (-) Transcript_34273:129-380(-)
MGKNTLVQFVKRLRVILCDDDTFNNHVMELSLLLHNIRVDLGDRNQLKRFFNNLVWEAVQVDCNVGFDVEGDGEEDDDERWGT